MIQQWDSGLVQWSEWMAVNVLVILGWLALVMLVIIVSISVVDWWSFGLWPEDIGLVVDWLEGWLVGQKEEISVKSLD